MAIYSVPQIDFVGGLSGLGRSYYQGLDRFYDDQAGQALARYWDSRGAVAAPVQQPPGLSGLGLGPQPAVYTAPLPPPGQAPADTSGAQPMAGDIAAPRVAEGFAAIPQGYLQRTASAESSNDPNARNPNSTATGLFQFTEGTWNDVARKYPHLGLTPDGRTDPEQSKRAMQVFTADNAKVLQANRIPPTEPNLYAAHFLGAGGAVRALSAPDTAPMAAVTDPAAVQANPFLANMTVGDFKSWAARKMGQGGAQAGAAPAQGGSVAGAVPVMGGIPSPATAQGRIPGDLLATLMRSPRYRAVGETLLREGIRPAGGQWTTYQLPDGSVWQRDSQTGKIDVVQRGASAQQNEFGLNPVYGVDAEGNPVIMQVGKSGQAIQTRLPEGVRLSKEPIRIDAGTHTVLLDPVTRQQIGTVPKNIATSEQQKVVGRAAGETQANAPKAAATLRDLEMQWQTVNRSIDDALNGIDWSTAGFVGDLTKAVPGSPAYNLARVLETIQANIGFDKLQSMRDNSPTGGALGQVSEFENRLLQAVRGSLAQGQSGEQLRRNLIQIQKDLQALQQERRRAFQQTYGQLPEGVGSGAGGAAPGGGSRGTVNAVPQAAIDYLRANPQYREQFDQKYGAGSAAQVLGQ